ncbi:MAG: hypothetical protein MK105_07675 [Crocinitomicaceae bacterium]|nr:hypothetical protein [Crocinitomicaceae bacterium]
MKVLLPIISALFIFSSCIKDIQDPVWIEVSEWSLVANPDQDLAAEHDPGVLSHAIKDVWLYVDNSLVGVYEVPFKVPVLSSGSKEIRLYPGVHNNGIAGTKKRYPFLKEMILTADLVPNEVVQIDPVTMYKTQTEFWIEDFDDASIVIEDGNATLVSMERVSQPDDPVIFDSQLNGVAFGRISLTAAANKYVGSTNVIEIEGVPIGLPSGVECYLEIDYHNTADLITGLIGVSSTNIFRNTMVRLNKQFESQVRWKKIYIDLREVVSSSTTSDYFEFSFDALLPSGVNSGEINIDNIKAVHF